jgi:hypothetical protein
MPLQRSREPVPAGIGLRGAFRSRSRVARSARTMLRFSVLAAGLVLTIFHVSLFWDRLVGGDLLDPAVALRWAGAGLIVSALVALRRFDVPLHHGRKAFSLWLLVAMLHASSGSIPNAATDTTIGLQTGFIFVLPSTAALLGFSLLDTSIIRRRLAPSPSVIFRVETGTTPRLSSGWRRGGASRAPPLALA